MVVFAGLFVLPLVYFLVISFWSVRARMMRPAFSLANYAETLNEYGGVLTYTALTAGAVAVLTTLVAFAFAYAIRFRLGRFGNAFLLITLTTLFGGYLVKIYAWKSILGTEGVLNRALLGVGLVREPLGALLYSTQGVVITLTYFLLPFAVLPIYGSLRSVSDVTIEAARDVGAGPFDVLRDIVLPQCRGGLMAAFTLSFLISVGDYVTPRFVGGGAALMGTFIENQFSIGFNWPLGSAMAFTTLAVTLLIVFAVHRLLEMALRQ
jgi:spermidine/putrescine transport system permease protein